ncbi:glycosyltransferase [Sphingobacterium deserti]|uniref:Glycosyl transferase family 2 n=1 Tax=Sphingobacterium deserti TaxID=1229276 RepID=A0A0B8T495_9SPHI|nr:glycosyltransferase [Sphingobacterium deserti]KGE14288.1 glycosyl transferase family 2 [Sphingobacterium deserti]
MITGSIVLYNNDAEVLSQAIVSFVDSPLTTRLYLIDNSPTDKLKYLTLNPKIVYIHNPSNPGFGAAHNIALRMSIDCGAKFHFVINPDVAFKSEIIEQMVEFVRDRQNIGMLMPQILNEDESAQYLPKLLPSPFSIFKRILHKKYGFFDLFVEKYELRSVETIVANVPILSGCFTLFNVDALKDVGLYDDAFFMYFEDWDISRRMHLKYQTIYYPKVSVYHGYESGANKNKRLFKIFVKSCIHYFNKWGWFLDNDRAKINQKTLNQFK